MLRPSSVPAVEPVCSTKACPVSVTPSPTKDEASRLKNLPVAFSPPGRYLAPIALSAPEPMAVIVPPRMSSLVGTSLPLFFALSFAIGPMICAASKIAGPRNAPATPPTAAPFGPATEPAAAPAPAPAIRVASEPTA